MGRPKKAEKNATENPRAVEGDNEAIKLPSDRGEATLWVYDRLKTLAGHKQMISEQIRGIKDDAKVHHAIPTVQLGTATRLARMTPEKRLAWSENVKQAVKLFGYDLDEKGETYGADANKELWGYMEQITAFDKEKRAIAGEEKAIVQAAVAAQIDVQSMRELGRYAKDDPVEVEEKVARLDQMFVFLQAHRKNDFSASV